MDLREFVKEAIVELAKATREADEELKELGGLVNPGTHNVGVYQDGSFVNARTTLNFDVAVSAESGNAGNAGAKAKVWVVEASIGGQISDRSQEVSRLSFSIDVVLPGPADQKARVGLVQKPR